MGVFHLQRDHRFVSDSQTFRFSASQKDNSFLVLICIVIMGLLQKTKINLLCSELTSRTNNTYEQPECAAVVDAIEERLNVSFHRCTTVNSTLNTFKYLYYHMKFGIFIKIQNSELRIFAPFVNTDYQNTWSDHLTIDGDGTLDTYYTQKAGLYREEQIEYDKTKWWANGNIIW